MKSKDTAPMKGQFLGTMSVLKRELGSRSKVSRSIIIRINEFRISEVCNHCKQNNMELTKLSDGAYTSNVFRYKNYNILWNRNINASKNVLDISLSA
ncbi:unnamed protein product [Rhizopus stolonifer]